jgi:hypothetical protein
LPMTMSPVSRNPLTALSIMLVLSASGVDCFGAAEDTRAVNDKEGARP